MPGMQQLVSAPEDAAPDEAGGAPARQGSASLQASASGAGVRGGGYVLAFIREYVEAAATSGGDEGRQRRRAGRRDIGSAGVGCASDAQSERSSLQEGSEGVEVGPVCALPRRMEPKPEPAAERRMRVLVWALLR